MTSPAELENWSGVKRSFLPTNGDCREEKAVSAKQCQNQLFLMHDNETGVGCIQVSLMVFWFKHQVPTQLFFAQTNLQRVEIWVGWICLVDLDLVGRLGIIKYDINSGIHLLQKLLSKYVCVSVSASFHLGTFTFVQGQNRRNEEKPASASGQSRSKRYPKPPRLAPYFP